MLVVGVGLFGISNGVENGGAFPGVGAFDAEKIGGGGCGVHDADGAVDFEAFFTPVAPHEEGDGDVFFHVGAVVAVVSAVVAEEDHVEGLADVDEGVDEASDALVGVGDGGEILVGHPAEFVTGPVGVAEIEEDEIEVGFAGAVYGVVGDLVVAGV